MICEKSAQSGAICDKNKGALSHYSIIAAPVPLPRLYSSIMLRFVFSRPVLSRPGHRPAPAWSRARVWRVAALLAVAGVGGARGASADEFSAVPAGDPIYRQLRAIELGEGQPATNLTRYEAALQTARVITRVANDPRADLSRTGWRALRDLTGSLQSELRQLGIDIEATRALTESRLQAPAPIEPSRGVSLSSPPLDSLGTELPPRSALRDAGRGMVLRSPGNDDLGMGARLRPQTMTSDFSASIMPRLRVGAALLALQRAESDPFKSSGAGQALLSPASGRVTGSDASVDYDVNSWLSVRAQTSQRSLLAPDNTPFLSANFFDGATQTRSAGGGVGVEVGPVNFFTEIARLSTDTGASGTSVGGGIGLSGLAKTGSRFRRTWRACSPKTAPFWTRRASNSKSAPKSPNASTSACSIKVCSPRATTAPRASRAA